MQSGAVGGTDMREAVIQLMMATLSTLGFSILFYVHPRRLPLASLGGFLTCAVCKYAKDCPARSAYNLPPQATAQPANFEIPHFHKLGESVPPLVRLIKFRPTAVSCFKTALSMFSLVPAPIQAKHRLYASIAPTPPNGDCARMASQKTESCIFFSDMLFYR